MFSNSKHNLDNQTNDIKKESLEEDDTFLPPRNAVHPTEKEKWLRIFYRSLLWLFIMLVAGLLVWGWRKVKGEA
ncbi:hypothetical protein [Paenibacillus radicis (ex Xue et al. 2023)]|uniref:Uncharacterized protein n=1 Tax=Paenibacillus radicis (ex Xue et al. 2023) TaxID=2972489 RepID=A0ABT1YMM7_9BACL|nr:hypothetical protein [Paenibacillus radicis (ex Xue et al. 2023)]MCR8634429.1 hypothetical protein [Paenibacillus radicis (ex Xue et al. 2023)]